MEWVGKWLFIVSEDIIDESRRLKKEKSFMDQ